MVENASKHSSIKWRAVSEIPSGIRDQNIELSIEPKFLLALALT
jgi:hypothetical protein